MRDSEVLPDVFEGREKSPLAKHNFRADQLIAVRIKSDRHTIAPVNAGRSGEGNV